MQKILVIKLGALGDFVLEIGGMMEVRRCFPEAELTLMTGKPFLSMGRQMGIFSHYIIDDRAAWLNLSEQARIIREVTQGGFDYIFDFQGVARTRTKYFNMFRWFSSRSFCWVDAHYHTARRVQKRHSWSLGKVTKEEYPFNLPVTDLSFLHGENKHFDELPERFVLFIPGCSPNHPYKRWPIAYFSELASKLAERGIHVVLIGTKTEAAEIEAIASTSPLAVNMLNKTSLLDIPDLARRAIATVGNDTGPSHMASLSGMPTIAIYDNRTKQGALRGPKSINLVSPNTIDKITVDTVWQQLLPILNIH